MNLSSQIEKITLSLSKSKIFLLFLISFIVGIWLSDLIILDNYSQDILIGCTVLLIFVFFIFIKEKMIRVLIFCLLILSLGLIYTSYFKEKITPKKLPYNQSVSFTGVVDAEPDIRSDKIKLTIEVTNTGNQYQQLLGQLVLVNVPRYPEYQYGDKLEISGQLQEPGLIETFDYGKYLSRYQIFAIINNPKVVRKIADGSKSKIYSSLFKIKNRFQESLNRSLSEPESSLAGGIIVGAKSDFPQDLKNNLNKTGTTHIVVISGQNMEIITSTFVNLTKYWSNGVTFSVGIVGLILFSIMTGASASVVRAAILASLFLLVRVVGRRKQIVIPLVFAGFIMLIINPLILRFDLGFQLSFSAMLGLIYISPIFANLMSKWPKIVSQSLAATFGAQIATLPIILHSFGRLSVLAPITNALILTAVPTAMGLSFTVGLIGIFSVPLAIPVGWFTWVFLKYIILVIQLFAKIPWISLNINFQTWWVVIYYLLLMALLIFYNKSHDRKMNK